MISKEKVLRHIAEGDAICTGTMRSDNIQLDRWNLGDYVFLVTSRRFWNPTPNAYISKVYDSDYLIRVEKLTELGTEVIVTA
jgi:hypothetical protein